MREYLLILIFKFDGIHRRVNRTAPIISALLFRLLVSELFSSCMLQDIICLFSQEPRAFFCRNWGYLRLVKSYLIKSKNLTFVNTNL
jgi:hypothetical protein